MTDETQTTVSILVGAEGAAEIANETWQRQATDEEQRQFIIDQCHGDEQQFKSLLIDGTGRPYWLLTILEMAPPAIHEKARNYVRCVRLTD